MKMNEAKKTAGALIVLGAIAAGVMLMRTPRYSQETPASQHSSSPKLESQAARMRW
jgi:hypothetical protein